jgi:hypothetical protein
MTRQRPVSPFTNQLLPAAIFLITALCLLPSIVRGQSATATLSGTVVDQNGAVVVGANITLINNGTTLQRQATTNEQGGFTIPLLPPGPYTLNAQRDGFSPVRVENVVLSVGDRKALQLQLKAGDVNAQVVVDSSADTIRTDGSVGTVVNRQFVANMPLNGRSLQALIQLTPGVVLTGSDNPTGGGQFSVNGQRTTSNYYMVDGVSANVGLATTFGGDPGTSGSGQAPGTTALGGTNSLVSLDALQEFRIETSTYAPEYGRTPGGQISLVTRSGTNDFHGSTSEYFRNEAMDANDWFANAHRLPKPKERQNLFGGVLGGPLYLPRFGEGGSSLWRGKDRVFFFASYEGLRLQQPQVQVQTVPTAALRAQAAPVFRPYLNALPLPNGTDFGDGTGQFAASYSDPSTFNIFALRLDGNITNNLTSFFRYSHAPSESKQRAVSLSTVQSIRVRNDSYTGGLTWVVKPQLSADVRVNWTRNAPWSVEEVDTFGGAVVPSASDIFAIGRSPSNSSFFFGYSPGGQFYWGAGNSDVQRQLNVVGTAAWSVRAHQLKFGVDYRRLLPLLGRTGNSEEGILVLDATSLQAGNVFFYYGNSNYPVAREPIISNLSLFAQDAWHASRRLTLTYGLRFERVPPPGEAAGRVPRALLGIENSVLQNVQLAPEGTPLFHSRLGEFAPRFGAAYQLHAKTGWETVLRGGAGIYYDLGLGYIANAFEFAYPYVARSFSCCDLPFPPRNLEFPSVPLVSPAGAAFFALDPNIRLPYTIQWNGTIEQSLGSAQVLTVGYVGAAGRRLLVSDIYVGSRATINTADGNSSEADNIQIQRNRSRSSYHALQLQYRRRLSRGLQSLASYTLARSEDDSSADINSVPPLALTNVFAQEWGPSSFDVRHVLSAAITYDFPKISGPTMLRVLADGWGSDLLLRYQSALPVNVTSTTVSFSDDTFFRQRPDLVPGQPLYINDPTVSGGRRFNRSAFVNAPPDRQGTLPRNALRGFSASQVDLALRREFKLHEQVRLQLRGELFNLFNHPNFANVDTNLRSGTFGQARAMLNRSLGGLNELYQMGGPRSGQLAVKLIW